MSRPSVVYTTRKMFTMLSESIEQDKMRTSCVYMV